MSEAQRNAKKALYHALNSGILIRPDVCEECGNTSNMSLHGHHYLGYDQEHWLHVKWWCVSCHTVLHSVPAYVAMTTFEQRSEKNRRASLSRSPEQRVESGRLSVASVPREVRSERMRRINAAKTPEQRSALARHATASLTPEQQAIKVQNGRKSLAAWLATSTPEQRSAKARKSAANRDPKALSAAGRKGSCHRWHGRECKCWER
jgi:hypothetical protein